MSIQVGVIAKRAWEFREMLNIGGMPDMPVPCFEDRTFSPYFVSVGYVYGSDGWRLGTGTLDGPYVEDHLFGEEFAARFDKEYMYGCRSGEDCPHKIYYTPAVLLDFLTERMTLLPVPPEVRG